MRHRTFLGAMQRTTTTFLSSFGFKWLSVLVVSVFMASVAWSQTAQPFVFTAASVNNGPAIAAFTRDDTTGALTPVAGSPFAVRDTPTAPMTVDGQGKWIFAGCSGGRICMYSVSSEGQVAETPNSPYSTSLTNAIALGGDPTGNYLYVVDGAILGAQNITVSEGGVESFQIVPNGNGSADLSPVQQEPVWIPNTESGAYSPANGTLYEYSGSFGSVGNPTDLFVFTTQQGALTLSQTVSLYNVARGVVMSPQQNYIAVAGGLFTQTTWIYQLVQPLTTAQSVGLPTFSGLIQGTFNNTGQLYYRSDGTNVHVYESSTGRELAGSPLDASSPGLSNFLGWVPSPSSPYFYFITNQTTSGYGIQAIAADPNTGLISVTPAIANPFGQGVVTSGPILVTTTPDHLPNPVPQVYVYPGTLGFGGVVVGTQGTPQAVTITSNGAVPLVVSGITTTANFSVVSGGTCTGTSFTLPVQSSCTVEVAFSPGATGDVTGILTISDNAGGSPTTQTVSLSGTGRSPAPAATLVPGSLTFAAITQGTTGTPQVVTLTSSGTAPLHVTGVSLSGGNAADFSLTTTCQGELAVNATCTITVNFSPLAAGVRLSSVAIADDAGNQSFNVSGTANPAAALGPSATGSTSASISAGQTAQYNLQAVPGAGFNGTLTFTCSGVPFAATCTVPQSVAVANGAAAPFTVSVPTSSAAAMAPAPAPPAARPNDRSPLMIATPLAGILALFLVFRVKRSALRPIPLTVSALLLALLVVSGMGCNSGGSSQPPPPPPIQNAATPSITPNGGTFTTGYPTVAITDATPGATIYYTTDGSTPTPASTVYAGAFTLKSAATVQAIATAKGYSTSSVASAAFKLQTAAGTYTVTVTPTAVANGSSKQLQLNPIQLTLTVN